VSVVDQRAWLATGAVRQLLLRAVLVLGGAFAVTVIGWLFCAGSANADVLPSAPSVPSVLSSVTSDVTAVAPKKLGTLAVPDLAAVGKQAHHVVNDLSDRVVPSVAPATDLVPHTDLLPLAERVVPAVAHLDTKPTTTTTAKPTTMSTPVHQATAHPLAHKATRVSPAPSWSRQPFVPVVQHRHVAQGSAPMPRPADSTPSPAGVGHHSPALPPLQPAGSSDSSGHGGTSTTGSTGGAQIPCTNLVADGLTMADTSSTPRITAGPGRQPGTSPD
jgi:hypothetical protein